MGACAGKESSAKSSTTENWKILLIGQANVGKTSLLFRFVDNTYPAPNTSTIDNEYKVKSNFSIDNKRSVNLQVYDTAGQEKFRTITSSYYGNSKGVVIVFDLTDSASFDALENWFNESDRYAENAVKILVGNKSDLADKRVVPREKAEEFANKKGVSYFETSALNGSNVQEAFSELCRKISEVVDNVLITE